ncbi:MAG: ABC transporter permease subunit, partial [Clostridia bacterium]|nr:ABC transporter permease subunit [Clostridia bacterium]
VLIIVFFSLFVALILRGKYKGRTVARAVFFLPVIISSGVVITALQENIMGTGISGNETTYLFQATTFETLLKGIGLPDKLMITFTDIINQLFDLSWKSGVQILLLLAAVNNIPKSSYEVAEIEGATEWEKFWKITFPMVSPTILVTVIYTVIDSFTDYSNQVMRLIQEKLNFGYYEYSSTMALVYFACVLIIIGIVGGLISRKVYYQAD